MFYKAKFDKNGIKYEGMSDGYTFCIPIPWNKTESNKFPNISDCEFEVVLIISKFEC